MRSPYTEWVGYSLWSFTDAVSVLKSLIVFLCTMMMEKLFSMCSFLSLAEDAFIQVNVDGLFPLLRKV